MKKNCTYFVLITILLFIDQSAKVLVAQSIVPQDPIEIIPGFFNLVHIQNRGAIFGFFSKSGSPSVQFLLMVASLGAMFLVIYYFFKTPFSETLQKTSLSLILAGALGNLADRIFRGYVIDFLDFYVKEWHWPSFNVADSCVSIGAVLLLIALFFRRNPQCSPSS